MLSLPAPSSPTGLFPGVGDFRGCAVVSGRWAAEGCRCARCPARPFKLCFLNFGGVVAAPPLRRLAVLASAPPSRCFGVMSREGAGAALVAEVIKGEPGGRGLPGDAGTRAGTGRAALAGRCP